MRFSLLQIGLIIFLTACGFGEQADKTGTQQSAGIITAREDLRKMGIDPDQKRLSVSKTMKVESYFADRPLDRHWNAGRKAINNQPFYTVTFTEPKSALGGVHQYFFHADSHQLLWVTRGQ